MAEMKEDRPVGRAAESPGDAPHGRGTIDAGHHVDNHVWAVRRGSAVPVSVESQRVDLRRRVRQQSPHFPSSGTSTERTVLASGVSL